MDFYVKIIAPPNYLSKILASNPQFPIRPKSEHLCNFHYLKILGYCELLSI